MLNLQELATQYPGEVSRRCVDMILRAVKGESTDEEFFFVRGVFAAEFVHAVVAANTSAVHNYPQPLKGQ